MAETRTDLLFQAKAKGFQEVQQQANKIIDAAQKATANQAKGFSKLEGGSKAYRKEIKGLEKDLKDLARQQLATTKAMEGMKKGSDVFKQLHENLKNINAQYSRLSTMKGKLQELFGAKGPGGQPLTAQDMARGGFMQGLVQGGLNVNLQRGPGMWRQAAGMAIGGMGRGFAGAPFGGVQGMQQGLAGIPGVGGFLAGQLGTVMGFGEQALELQRTRLGALPLFGGGGAGLQRIRQARARAQAGVKAPAGGFMSQEFIGAQAEQARRGAEARTVVTPEMQKEIDTNVQEALLGRGRYNAAESLKRFTGEPTEYAKGLVERVERDRALQNRDLREKFTKVQEDAVYRSKQRAEGEAAAAETRKMLSEPEAAFKAARQQAGSAAAARERGRPFMDVRKAGQQLAGLSEDQAIQAISPMLQRAGGGIEAAKQQGMIPAAFAAQTVYGVGAETAGAFLGAGRRGGMVGAEGRSAEMMAETIGDALSLGLEGSELTEYMQQMANGFESWKQTGMPINPKSIQALSTTFAGAGLGGVRGAVMGQQFGGAAQRITQTGVQDAIDLMMLQEVGGYKGGGMESYMEAMKKMESLGRPGEEGGVGAEELTSMVRKLHKAGGGGASGTWTVREALGRKGIKMGVAEAEQFTQAALAPEGLGAEQMGRIAKFNEESLAGQERGPSGAGGLVKQAQEMMTEYGGAIRRAAALQNEQAAVGSKMLPTLQNLQKSSLNINKAFQTLADEGLGNLSKQIEKFTGAISKIATMMDENGQFWNVWTKLVTGSL